MPFQGGGEAGVFSVQHVPTLLRRQELESSRFMATVQEVVQLRTRAVFHLPENYEHVRLGLHTQRTRTAWRSMQVNVNDGTALIDFWARVPLEAGGTRIGIEVSV